MESLGRRQFHILFFPYMGHGHMIPTMDLAKLFALRGLKSTIVTTPLNVPYFSKSIERMKDLGLDIGVQVVKFPSLEAGLPEGYENEESVKSLENAEMLFKFFLATTLFQDPLEKLFEELRPDCIVADLIFLWATDSADRFGIPRLVFCGSSFFASSATECVRIYEPHKNVGSDSEPFVIPNLPGEIMLTRTQLLEFGMGEMTNDGIRFLKLMRDSALKSYGVIVNSFYELEHDYADHFRNVLGRKAWHVGPVSLCNKNIEDKVTRGGKITSINEKQCLNWLDTKEPNSVIYISFGSTVSFTALQLKEIALALESSGHQFIWVIRRDKGSKAEQKDWLPENFERRMEGKGLIIRGWAPQVLILDHQAIGGFVTHCGWNSTLEAVTAGVPMVTWPIEAEQFYNEKLITDVLKIGVNVSAKAWAKMHSDPIESEAIKKIMCRVMVGEEAEGMRSRVKKLSELARNSVEEGGSSYMDLGKLIDELVQNRNSVMNKRNAEADLS